MTDIQALDRTYVANTYARFPVELATGKGSILTDINGKDYIDMGSGIAVNGFGAADDQWIAAVTEQLGRLPHASNLYYTEPCAKLAELLCSRTGMKKVFFGNSGAEANECAIKVARKYSAQKKGAEVHTSQIAPYNYIDAWKPMLEQGHDILYLCMSSGLTATSCTGRWCRASRTSSRAIWTRWRPSTPIPPWPGS